MRKHLIYAEDLVYEIMQYPGGSVPKSVIRAYAETAVTIRPVGFWQHMWNRIRWLFKKAD